MIGARVTINSISANTSLSEDLFASRCLMVADSDGNVC